MLKSELTRYIKQTAKDRGFSFCGIAEAVFLDEESVKLKKWLEQGFHGEMGYMENNYEKRTDPQKLVRNARSVITFLYNYSAPREMADDCHFKISKYAYGEDYHHVIRNKLYQLVDEIKTKTDDFDFRVFVDSAPVMEKVWAQRSGLGWLGKNTCLINREMGSWLFICEIICSLELNYDQPLPESCGVCTRCIDACPTGALTEPFVLDSNRCISYLTIEFRDALPSKLKEHFDGWIFGCDICQDVCPWNRFSKPHQEPLFNLPEEIRNMNNKDWQQLTEPDFKRIFKNSAIKRTRYDGLMRNIEFQSDKL